MNILITPDIHEWAIGSLVKSIIKGNGRFNFYNIAVHPRGVAPGVSEIKNLMREGVRFDLWHPQYWRSAEQIISLVPELKEIPIILTHHNHYQLRERNWKEYDALAIATKWGAEELRKRHGKVYYVPMGIDMDLYGFIDERMDDGKTIGYMGRIVAHKNIDLVCGMAEKLGFRVYGTGYIDKPEYYLQKVKKYQDNGILIFNGNLGRQNMTAKNFAVEAYRKMSVLVAYSTGEVETGVLPILEAMARGVPVLAMAQGMARDLIEDGVNGFIFDENNFEKKLKMVMEDRKLQEKIRQNAWRTIKNYSELKMARDFGRIYYEMIWQKDKLISVIIPTFNRADNLIKSLVAIEKQEYRAKEIIVCDDGSSDYTKQVVSIAKKELKTPILYLKTGTKLEYGLAKSRNQGAVEARGDVLVFLDDRLVMTNKKTLDNIIKSLLNNFNKKVFFYGSKITNGKISNKEAFMENFSWIEKRKFIRAGMFCERMDMYGGLSEETRKRFAAQGFEMLQAQDIIVEEMERTARNKRKDEIWRMKFKINKMYD